MQISTKLVMIFHYRFIYKTPVNLQTPEMAVETLKAAHQFMFPELVLICVTQLHQMLSLSNVLYIFANVCFLCNDLENLEVKIYTSLWMKLVL